MPPSLAVAEEQPTVPAFPAETVNIGETGAAAVLPEEKEAVPERNETIEEEKAQPSNLIPIILAIVIIVIIISVIASSMKGKKKKFKLKI